MRGTVRAEINTAMVLTIQRMEEEGEMLSGLLPIIRAPAFYKQYQAAGTGIRPTMTVRTWCPGLGQGCQGELCGRRYAYTP